EIGGGVGLEARDAHVAEARLANLAAHAGRADDLARHAQLERSGLALAQHGHIHLGARRAAQRTAALVALGRERLAVHGHDHVAGTDAGTLRRASVHGRDHADAAVGQLHHFHADALVSAGGAFLEGLRIAAL